MRKNWLDKLFWWLSGGGNKNDGKKEENKPEKDEIKEEEKIKTPSIEKPPMIIPPINIPDEIEIEAHTVKESKGNLLIPVGIKFGKLDSRVNGCSKVYLESFGTITSMIYTLDHRINNNVMYGLYKSRDGSFRFTGTNSYEEARDIYKRGYTKILPEIREKVKSLVVKYNNYNSSKSSVNNDFVGFIPNVPNALMNLPSSMIHRKSCPRRTKTLHIIYFMGGNCSVDKDIFKNSGIVLLAAIQIIEKRRIDVMLEVGFFGACGKSEILGGVVKLKGYQEKLNIQKLCFPIAHPSFFRRFGLRFIETFPAMKDQGYRDAYGHAMNLESLKKCFTFKDKNAIILNALFIKEKLNNDVEKLITHINSQCK